MKNDPLILDDLCEAANTLLDAMALSYLSHAALAAAMPLVSARYFKTADVPKGDVMEMMSNAVNWAFMEENDAE